MSSKRYLKADVDEVLRVGAQMSNICFNLGQHYDRPPFGKYGEKHTLEQTTMKTMYDLQKQWDAAVRKVKR